MIESAWVPDHCRRFQRTSCNYENRIEAAADSVLLLRGGNKTIYPMVKDCADAIRDPSWLDLPPIRCKAAASLTLPSVGTNSKLQGALVVLAPEQQQLMSRILRCDIEGVRHVLFQLGDELKGQLMSVISEHTDRNRNIIHACISMCSLTSNKDSGQDLLSQGSGASGVNGGGSTAVGGYNPAGWECINVITNTMMDNRPVSIWEIMRRDVNRETKASNSNRVPLLPNLTRTIIGVHRTRSATYKPERRSIRIQVTI